LGILGSRLTIGNGDALLPDGLTPTGRQISQKPPLKARPAIDAFWSRLV
jgi:hypothetical protein